MYICICIYVYVYMYMYMYICICVYVYVYMYMYIYVYVYGICLITSCFRQLELQGRAISSRTADAFVYSLWSLLPSFCNYPFDMAESFKDLKKALCSALHEEPDTRGVICSSLQILIQQNKKILEEKSEMPDTEEGIARQRAVARYTPQVAAKNMSVLKSSAHELLNVLSGVLLQSKTDDGGSLQVLKPSQSIENAVTVNLGCWQIDLFLIL